MAKMKIDELARMMHQEFQLLHGEIRKVQIVQDRHTETLASHTEILAEHTEILAEHTAILQDHGDRLASIEQKVDVTIKLVDRHDVRLDQGDQVLKKLTRVR